MPDSLPQQLRYRDMQKRHYDDNDLSPEHHVGNYAYHENVPYETFLLHAFGDVRKPIFADFSDLVAFDYACGEGRMVRRMSSFFKRVDGCDLSAKMVSAAQQRCPQSNIYPCDGMSCGSAAEGTYDFVYTTLSLQHICVYETRRSIIEGLQRLLKPSGKMTLQMVFSKYFPYVPDKNNRRVTDGQLVEYFREDTHNAGYFDNKYEAQSTNGLCDVVIGTADLPKVKEDFLRLFLTVDFSFYDIGIGRGFAYPVEAQHPHRHRRDTYWATHYIFIHATGPKLL